MYWRGSRYTIALGRIFISPALTMTHVAAFLDRLGATTDAGEVSGAVLRNFQAVDIDEHTKQLLDWNLNYDQLDGGVFRGEFTDIRTDGMQVFVESTNRRVRQRGHLPPGTVGIATLLTGQGKMCINGLQGHNDTLVFVHATELDLCTPPDCVLAGVVIDVSLLDGGLTFVPGMREALDTGTLLAVTPPQATLAPLQSLLKDVAQAAREQPQWLGKVVLERHWRDALQWQLASALVPATSDDTKGQARANKRLVDEACEWMLIQVDEPPSMLSLCQQFGVSPRKLSYCFQDVLGMSPARYFKVARLNAVRRELRRAHPSETSVYDIAARWGFWHFGHFSADYKKFFSELPSDTLRGFVK